MQKKKSSSRMPAKKVAVDNYLVGHYQCNKKGAWVVPANRRIKLKLFVNSKTTHLAEHDDLVVVEVLGSRKCGRLEAKVVKRLGPVSDPAALSSIAVHDHDLPQNFPTDAMQLAQGAKLPPLRGREDLRKVPLVTIDDEDARDFDDAVWADPDSNPNNPGGWCALVAIADVAYYVRPEDSLDQAASERGNSVYLPDRVIPMLPEALSNNMCSLVPNEDRACLAVYMWLDKEGNLLSHRFVRGIMRSAARLTYKQVQHTHDQQSRDHPLCNQIDSLYGVFEALMKNRKRRGTLDFDLPERKIVLDDAGNLKDVEPRHRLDSHKLIEELMILANVAAAKELERLGKPVMYRIHDNPDPMKIHDLKSMLKKFGFKLPKGEDVEARALSKLVKQAKDTPYEQVINMLVLRSQSQAEYSPNNIGHFGLQLASYCHFTSPIRRYSDILVHRALIAGLDLGSDGSDSFENGKLKEIGWSLSETERRATLAERDTVDRYVAAFMVDQVGQIFTARITGVAKFGLFVTIENTGATGFVPVGTLADDYYQYDEKLHSLTGRRKRFVFCLGDLIKVRLEESTPLTGSMEFRYIPKRQKKQRKSVSR